jgi:WhiB family transcriptional regulator, redox-sensing transcriptional regulator
VVSLADEVLAAAMVRLLHLLGELEPWQLDAACREHPGVDYFPERGASTKEARAVCAGCLVRAECLDYALRIGTKHGIWGGMSERERRRLRRDRSLAA